MASGAVYLDWDKLGGDQNFHATSLCKSLPRKHSKACKIYSEAILESSKCYK